MSAQNFLIDSENETSTIVHHLVSLFMTYCKSRDERLSRKTAELIVGIFLLKPYWNTKFQQEASKHEIQNFMRDCFNFLYDENSISSTTVKMQSLFYGKYLTREQFKEHKKEIIMKNCHHLLQKLKKVWHNPTEDFSEMHDDLVKFIVIKEGMDDKEDHSAFDEIKTAVNSVLPASELSVFVLNNQKIKTVFINEVSSIAAGIRLHAWYGNRAGKFMFDVGKLMKETLPKVTDDIHEETNVIEEMIEIFQTSLKDEIERIGDGDDLLHKKQLLISTVNYYSFLKVLKENIDEIATETYRLDYKFIMCMKDLNSALTSGPFSKADKAYPFYKEIGQTWKDLQSEGYLLDFYTSLFIELKELHEHALKIPQIKDDDNAFKIDELEFELPEEKPILVEAHNTRNFSDVTLDIQGFCAYYCSMGVLVPSIKELGILKYKNSCYGFSSNKAMKYFQKQPNVNIGLAIKYMHIMPELIITLCKEEYFGLPILNMTRQKEVLPVFVAEQSVQTVLHNAENIDYSYNWNQWNMRRDALKRADLMNRKTHSTQTDLSHFRRENHSQVYLPKDNWTQTRRDSGTFMSRTGVPELYRTIRKSFL